MRRLMVWVTGYTFAWLVVYIPLESIVTLSLAGVRGLLYSAYILNACGMALMLWGAVSARRQKAFAPGLLATGWGWTAATFWRATADRFWYASLGQPLMGGRLEFWLAPLLTALALLGLAGSLALVLRWPRASD